MLHTWLLLLGALLLPACATFADDPSFPTSHPAPSASPSAFLEVSVDAYTVTPGGRGYLVAPWGWPWLIEQSLAEAELFSAVSQERDYQDLHVSLDIEVAHTPMSGALLSVLTAFLIPATDQRAITVSATLSDLERGIQTSAQAHHQFRTWLQLFLLPLWFTHDPGSYEYDAAVSMSTSVVSEALSAWSSSLPPNKVLQRTGE